MARKKKGPDFTEAELLVEAGLLKWGSTREGAAEELMLVEGA